ncbi:MAG: hypothetical protein ACI89L_001372 [Phycisphaerales bacterium]
MPSQMFIRRLTASLAVALTALPSLGQIIDLSPVIPTKSVIRGTEQAAIDTFVDAHTKQIESGDITAVIRSRTALTKPLESPSVTRAFRRAYGDAVLPVVQSLLASDETVRQMAGLRIAGKLGTDEAAQLLLDRMSDLDEGTRFFVITCLGETMSSMITNSSSLSTATATDVVSALGGAIKHADSATFADAGVRALAVGTRISQPQQVDIRSLVIVSLAESAGDRLRGIRANDPDAADEMIAALRACGAVRDAISLSQSDPTPAAAKAAVRLGADCVGYVYSRVRSGAMAASGAQEHEIALLIAGESAIYRGRIALKEPAPPQTNLFDQLKEGNEREFSFRASELVGPKSSIVGNHGFDQDRFIRPAADD